MASITVATFQDCIEQGYIIRAFCIPCQRCVLIDLHALAQAGYAKCRYVGRQWRCSLCGKLGHIIVWPPAFHPQHRSTALMHPAPPCVPLIEASENPKPAVTPERVS